MTRNLLAGLARKALAGLALCGLATGAVAADLPSRSPAPYYPVPPIFSWTGFYLGANAGFGIGNGTFGGSADFGNQSGGLIGATGGYNYQSGPLVVGIEGDLDFAGVGGTGAPKFATFTSGNTTGVGSLRGRFGYAFDRALVYFTGGYTGANMRGSLVDNSANPNLNFSQSNYLNGYALGLGLEFAVTPNISVKAEYLYSNYGTATYFPATVDQISAGTRFSTLKGGANYHF